MESIQGGFFWSDTRPLTGYCIAYVLLRKERGVRKGASAKGSQAPRSWKKNVSDFSARGPPATRKLSRYSVPVAGRSSTGWLSLAGSGDASCTSGSFSSSARGSLSFAGREISGVEVATVARSSSFGAMLSSSALGHRMRMSRPALLEATPHSGRRRLLWE